MASFWIIILNSPTMCWFSYRHYLGWPKGAFVMSVVHLGQYENITALLCAPNRLHQDHSEGAELWCGFLWCENSVTSSRPFYTVLTNKTLKKRANSALIQPGCWFNVLFDSVGLSWKHDTDWSHPVHTLKYLNVSKPTGISVTISEDLKS